MSDTFDHEAEAWGSLDDYLNDGGGPSWRSNGWTTCRYCRKSTQWKHTGAGWRLTDGKGNLHNCLVKPPSIDGFEVLS